MKLEQEKNEPATRTGDINSRGDGYDEAVKLIVEKAYVSPKTASICLDTILDLL